MAIYTKKGDRGLTSLYGESGQRRKDDLRIKAYGTVDELNSQLGFAISLLSAKSKGLKPGLVTIQKDLFEIASTLATPSMQKPPFEIGREKTVRLEKIIDSFEGSLPVLQNFIYPGGSKAGAAMHVARTVCRRAEREIVTLANKEKVDPQILIYINRLSDTLFMLAREVNRLEKKQEEIWKK